MRILQVHNRYALAGGEDTISDAEAELLAAADHVVQRYRVDNPSTGRRAVTQLAGAAWNPRQARFLGQAVRDFKPDVAHVHNTWFTLSPAVFHALDAEDVPIVMTLQNYRLLCGNGLMYRDGHVCTECVGTHPWRVVKHQCYRGSAPQSAIAASTLSLGRARKTWDLVGRFLAPSHFVRDFFVQAGFDPERIVVKPNVVADPGARDTPPSQSTKILYVGRLSPEKGLDTLMAGWALSGCHAAGLELVVIGDGPERDRLAAAAPPGVRMIGWVSSAELPQHLLSARALVFPTEWFENFGRVIVEAMAAGLPVLASDIATPGEVVGQLGRQWLVPPEDVEGWAAGLDRLLDDDAVDSAGLVARGLFELYYSLDVGLRDLTRIYGALVRPS